MSTGEENDEHSNMEQQSVAVTPIVNIDDAPVATHGSLRRIASVPATDNFHNSFEQLSLDISPSQVQRSPSLPRTGTMLMREQQDQLMTTLLSSVSAVLRLLKNSSEVSELMTAAQSMSMLCGRGMCLCVCMCVYVYMHLCVCSYVYVCVSVCMSCICMCDCVYICVCMCSVYLCMFMHLCHMCVLCIYKIKLWNGQELLKNSFSKF